MENMVTIAQDVGPIVSGADIFVASAILDDIQKEVENTKTCPCDDYDVSVYENNY